MTDLRLNDGRTMPALGFGTYRVDDIAATDLVREAIGAGYRLIDTAMVYSNERGVGEGLRRAGGPAFITTKCWNSDQGYGQAKGALERSLDRLGLEAVDLYLIHWPVPSLDRFVGTWKALIELREAGKTRSIGVSNFRPEHIDRLERETGVLPAVNQIELHPAFQQREARAYHAEKGIVTQSWSPLGQGGLVREPRIGRIAEKHGSNPGAVIIAWHLALGLSAIPKAASLQNMRANLGAAEIRLDEEDMATIEAMDDPNGRTGPDPLTFEVGAR